MGSRIGVLVLLGMCAWPGAMAAQSHNPPLVIASMTGRDLFQFYCATCHGRDAKGAGPAAAALKTPPADLTRIAARNGNQFPRAAVTAFVADAKPMIPAHGSAEMPVWGPIFRALDSSDTRAKMRIDNLVDFLESMQTK
jgi:mono/diheme cytochrome c family protein